MINRIRIVFIFSIVSLLLVSIPTNIIAQSAVAPQGSSQTSLQHAPMKTRPEVNDSAKQRVVSSRANLESSALEPLSSEDKAMKHESSKKSMIYLEETDIMSFDQERLPDIQLLRGNVKMRHDSTYLYADSVYFNQKANDFIAFSNVRIEQGDTLFVYGDVLYYDGNSKMARLRDNVSMLNRDVILTTDSLNYDRILNVGYYFKGGKITDGENVLTSQSAYYYPGVQTAVFHKDVEGTNPSMVLNSDTLQYNTETKVASILGPTTIVYNTETEIYSEYGWYNMETEISELLDNSVVTHNDGKQLKGDTIFYDKRRGLGKAFNNVELSDSINNMLLTGNYGYYAEKGEIGLVTDSALMREYSNGDTLYLHADTLYTFADSTFKVVEAFHNVRFYRDDLQGKADSIIYNSRDSVLHLITRPVIWSEKQQLNGDTIRVYSKENNSNIIHIINNAFAIQQEDSVRFNQLSGKEIFGFIKDKKLQRVEVHGNAESLFFPKDEEELIGMNQTESSLLMIHFNDGKMYRIVAKPAPKAVTYPIDKVTKEMMYLRNYSWQDQLRPKRWQDVFLNPQMPEPIKNDALRQQQREKEKADRAASRKNKDKENQKASAPEVNKNRNTR